MPTRRDVYTTVRILTTLFLAQTILIAMPDAVGKKTMQVVAAPIKAPTLDGEMKGEEWDSATKLEFPGVGAVRVGVDRKFLYVGIEGKSPAVLSVFFQVKDRVYVLHSSARLGTAIYQRDEKVWKRLTEFTYRKDSKEFLKKEGWRGSHAAENGHVELAISRKLVGIKGKKASVRMAIGTLDMRAGKGISLPATAGDDTSHQRLLMGYTPEQLSFDPDRWIEVSAGKGKKARK